jgi:hypothetical protein
MVTFLYKHPVTSCRLNISSCEIDIAIKWVGSGGGSGGSSRAECGARFELDEWSKWE